MATAAMTLATSCSSDAVVEEQQAANAIQFGVTTGNASRAASYYCNNDKPTQFNVWAATDGKTYFENESFSQKGGTGNWTIDGDFARFWPSTEVSFFAVKNQTAYKGDVFADVAWNGVTPTIAFTVEKPVQTEASKQQDLLYAYTKKTKTVADNECVAILNFRHALSQVVFKAQNKNKNIYVEISEVQVANLKTTGTFTFPTNVTDGDALNNKHDQSGVITDNDASFGKWINLGTTATYTRTGAFGPIAVPCNKKEGENLEAVGVVNLTNNEGTAKGDGSDKANEQQNKTFSLIVLPQELAHAAYDKVHNKWEEDKAYFKVTCLVKNVAKGDGLAATKDDVTLYNGDIYIPVDIKWEVGKKYIYTFVFSEKGHGGYDEHGNDVLIPIEFNVTVDDFADAKNNDINI